jgi:hypothetical protein
VFDSRATATEFLDRPDCDPALAAASYRFRHDALLSIRRGFKISELSTLLRQLDRVTVSVEPARWFRIAAIIRFKPEKHL